MQGTLKGGGTAWTPAVYSRTQQEAVLSFYRRGGWSSKRLNAARELGAGCVLAASWAISTKHAALALSFGSCLPVMASTP